MKAVLQKEYRFEAAHFLPMVPEGHQCRRLHGHSFRIQVAVEGEIDPQTGFVIDYGEISEAVKPVLKPLDHQFLNAVPGLENPTSELLAVWIWQRVKPRLPGLKRITVLETCRSQCAYEGE